MGGFEIFNHTADVGIKVWGINLRELFKEAAKGMVSLIVDAKTVQEKEKKDIYVQGENTEDLLLCWLREILFCMENKGMVFCKFHIEKDNFAHSESDNCFVYASLGGERLDSTRHDICTEVKAVTRHGLFVKKQGPRWEAKILFDV